MDTLQKKLFKKNKGTLFTAPKIHKISLLPRSLFLLLTLIIFFLLINLNGNVINAKQPYEGASTFAVQVPPDVDEKNILGFLNNNGGTIIYKDAETGVLLVKFNREVLTSSLLNSHNIESAETININEKNDTSLAAKINPDLRAKLQNGGRAKVIVTLQDPVNIKSKKTIRKAAINHFQQEVIAKLPEEGFSLESRYSYIPAFSAYIDNTSLESLGNSPLVKSVRLPKQTSVISTESIPLIGADIVHAPPYELTGKGMTVAILDTGADTDHPDFTFDNAIEDEKCFTSDIYNDQEPPQLISAADCQGTDPTEGDIAEDFHGHGTNVAGIITSPNGFAPDAGIVPIRVTNDAGIGAESDWLRALDWIISNQETLSVDTINISMEVQNPNGTGIFYSDHTTCDATYPDMYNVISQLNALGITVFAGTGNRGARIGISSPACLSNVIAAGATYDSYMGREPNVGTYRDPGTGNPDIRWADCYDSQSYDTSNNRPYIACFSNIGTSLNNIVAAPGVKLMSTNLGGGQSEWYGTSQASPVTASIGTLMLQLNSSLTSNEIKTFLQNTGSPVYTLGGGYTLKLIDAHQAIEGVIPAECQSIADIPEVECTALKVLYDNTNGISWNNKSNWLTTNTTCSWFGISCQAGHTSGLNLPSNNLIGNLPTELQNLKSLITLNLNDNQLTDDIPREFGNLNSLQTLDLATNKIENDIPGQLGNLTDLTTLDLSNNQLYGEIPAVMSNLVNLATLDLGYNRFFALDAGLITFLGTKDPDWDQTQTVPPTNIQVELVDGFEHDSVRVSWDPINYQLHGGYYQASYSTLQDGPYTPGCTTNDKTEASCEMSNLDGNTTYYFVIQSYTPAHDIQQNVLLSDYSVETSLSTPVVRYVTTNGNCNGKTPCYSDIQSAVDASPNWEIIKVGLGTYTGGNGEVVNINKSVAIVGGYSKVNWFAYNPDANETIIDAENITERRGITLSPIGTDVTKVKGLKIQNGSVSSKDGGGIYSSGGQVTIKDVNLSYNSSASGKGGGVFIGSDTEEIEIIDSVIELNTAQTSGGGIYIEVNYAIVTIINNEINNNFTGGLLVSGEYNNTSISGNDIYNNDRQGIYIGGQNNTNQISDNNITNNLYGRGITYSGMRDNASYIQDNVISGNYSENEGGGIWLSESYRGDIYILRNQINSNEAVYEGGGLYVGGYFPYYIIQDNTIESNQTSSSFGFDPGGGGVYVESHMNAIFISNVISNNITASRGRGILSDPSFHDLTFRKNIIINNIGGSSSGEVELIPTTFNTYGTLMENDLIANNSTSGLGNELLVRGGNLVGKHLTISGTSEYGIKTLESGEIDITNSIIEGYSLAGSSGSGITGDYLLFYGNGDNCVDGALCTNVFHGDPLFEDKTNGDFHINIGSEAIDKGIDLGITEDIDKDTRPQGYAPDLGADEFPSPSCNDITEIPLTECEALNIIFNNTSGPDWVNNDGWLQTAAPCSWYGITCSGGHVASIDLNYNNLAGTLPTEIQNLPYVDTFLLNGNSLSGNIPSGIGGLGSGSVTDLNLSNNQFVGEIPQEIINQSGLTSLDLAYNRLESNNQPVLGFLQVNDPDWDQTQTIPPSGIKIMVNPDHSLKFAFQPIPYQGDGGYYRIIYSTVQGGPYLNVGCMTNDKSANNCTTPAMLVDEGYYFILQTFTPAHAGQTNSLWSRFSEEFEVVIVPNKEQLINYINIANGTGNPAHLYLTPQPHQFDLTAGIPEEEINGLPTIIEDVTIVGSGATIRRNNINENVPYFRIFNVDPTGKLRLEDIYIQNGDPDTEGGGAIRNSGELVLDTVNINQNISRSGGAIQNLGTATIISSTIQYNMSFGSGGGIENTAAATLTVQDSTITENIAGSGGGGINNAGTLNVTESEITNNLGASGGGISNGGSVTISSTSITGNSTIDPNLTNDPGIGKCDHDDPYKGGGICNYGAINVESSIFHSNGSIDVAGGIYNDSTASMANINNSCIISNTAKKNDAITNDSVNEFDAKNNWWGFQNGPTPSTIIEGNIGVSPPLTGPILGCPSGMVHDNQGNAKSLQALPYKDSEYIDATVQALGSLTPSCGTNITKGVYYQVTDDKALAETIIGRARIGGIIGRARIGGIIGRARIGGIIGRARIGGIIGQDKFRLNARGEDFTPVIAVFKENDLFALEEISCEEGLNNLAQLEVSLNPGINHYMVVGFKDTDDGILQFQTESMHNVVPAEVVDYNLNQIPGYPNSYYINLSLLNVRDYNLNNLQIKLLAEENNDKAIVVDGNGIINTILQGTTVSTGNQLQIELTSNYTYGENVKLYVELTEEVSIDGEPKNVTSTVPIIVPQKLKFEFWDFDDELEIINLPAFPPLSDPRYMGDELAGMEEYAVRWIEDIDIPYNTYYSLTHDKGGELSEQFYNRMVGKLTGTFTAEHTGLYEFYLTVQDGAKLLINGNTVIDDTGARSMIDGSVMGSAALTEGLHDIEIQYFEDQGGHGLMLEYKDPTMSFPEIIPSRLFGTLNPIICGTLCNENFEQGELYWNNDGKSGSVTVDTNAPYEGTKSLKTEQLYTSGDPARWTGITQHAQVNEGTTYRLRLWLKTLNASNGHVRARWRDESGSILSTQYPIGGINGTDSTWFSSEATITAPVNATKAELSIWHGVVGPQNSEGSTIWLDNITLICDSLCNRGFEDGYSHWESKRPGQIEVLTTNSYEGAKSIKIIQDLDTSDAAQWSVISQKILVTGGENYDLSFWLKKENAARGHVKVIWGDANDQAISQQYPIGGINGTNQTWSQMSTTLTAPVNAGTAELFFLHGVDGTNNNVFGSTLYIDDVIFLPVPTNESPTINILQPDGTNDSTTSSYTILWEDSDPDDNASISLYYDTDNSSTDGTLIVSGINEDSADYYVWNTSSITPGDYYIYGTITDSTNPQVVDYSAGPLTILPPCGQGICNPSFEDNLDYWSQNGTPNNTISTDAIDGINSLKSEHTRSSAENPSWSGVNQKINSVQPAQTYGLGMWIKSQNAAQGHVKIKWYNSGGAVSQVDYPIININGTLAWTSFSKLVTSPADAVMAEISIWHGINTSSQNVLGSTLWIDNIEFDVATSACGTLCNENFEQGLLYWTISGAVGSHNIETTGQHEGLKTAKSEQLYTSGDTAKWAGITQYAQVKEGITYRLRAWLKTANASNGHVRARWRNASGTLISTQYPITGINGTNSTWFKAETTVTAPANAAKAEISIWHGVNGGVNIQGSTMWIDDITMICQSLCNGGFEDGTIHWEANGKNEAEVITTDVQEGAQAVKVVQGLGAGDQEQWAGVSQRTIITGGNNYSLSFWLKKENAVQGHVKVKWRDTNDQLISQQFPIGGINGTNLTWVEMNTTLSAPANAETVEIFIWHGVDGANQNATGSTLYIDNTTFEQTP